MSIRNTCRQPMRPNWRRPLRNLNRAGLRGRRRGPDDFAQALTAFRRALRAHRKLARLAPSFFDEAVMARERENRAEQQRWMALWKPAIAKAYGIEVSELADLDDGLPRLPHPNTCRAVDRELAELQLWLAAGHVAMDRYQQRNPHALLSWTRMARYLDLAFDLKKMVLGLDSPNPLPQKITYDYEFTDLKRAYGHLLDPAPPAAAASPEAGGKIASGAAIVPASCVSSSCAAQPPAALPAAPPGANPEGSRRCDAWSRWARQMQKNSGIS